jgi:HAE1 family hydrophobic/amphiphilic exporter-1
MDKPNLLAHINRERAAALGVDVQEIADTLRVSVGGDDRVSRYYDALSDDAYDVELRLVGVDRADTRSISQLYVRAMQPAIEASGVPLFEMAGMPLISGLGFDGRSSPLTRIDNVVSFE